MTSPAEPKHAKNVPTDSGKSNKQVTALRVVLVILIIAILVIGGFTVYQWIKMNQPNDNPVPEPVEETSQTVADIALPDNPIDFASLKQQNEDIYAWIYIPGTDVNYPVLQSPTDDSFYLNHDENGNSAWQGSIYSELKTMKDFTDPVTVLYGHQTDGTGMFTTLHYFEDADFFNTYDTIYIYIPSHVLTYKIVSAYQFDDRHILNSFDFSKESVRAEYFAYVCNPDSLVKNVRPGITLKTTDRILQLSTCLSLTDSSNRRYIVTGVLSNDQPTK